MIVRALAALGLIGGVLAVFGVFLPWIPLLNISGWDLASLASIFGEVATYVYLVLLGGILALIGSIALLAGKRGIAYVLPFGGIITIAGWGWTFVTFGGPEAAAYGFYFCIFGGILALIGSIGLRR